MEESHYVFFTKLETQISLSKKTRT